MALIPSIDKKDGLVNRHINTAYDVVKLVSDNIGSVTIVSGSITDGSLALAIAAPAATSADVDTTNANVLITNADVLITNADALVTTTDKIQTQLDAIATASDRLVTNADVVITNADAVLANLWANGLEDIIVENGEFSAFHWAKKSQASALGGLTYQGSWDASTGTYPAGALLGEFYKVSVAGVVDTIQYDVGDDIIRNNSGGTNVNTDWDRQDNNDAIISVGGNVGVITNTQLLTSITSVLAGNAIFSNSVQFNSTVQGGDTATDFRLQSISNNNFNFQARNALGGTVYFGATAGANANAQISNAAGSSIVLFNNDRSTIFQSKVGIGTAPVQDFHINQTGFDAAFRITRDVSAIYDIGINTITRTLTHNALEANLGSFSWATNNGVALTILNNRDVSFNANLSIANNSMSLNLGSGAPFYLNHDGTNANINNSTGLLYIRSLLAEGLVSIQTPRTSGSVQNVLVMGGAQPLVKQYFDGNLSTESITGGLYFGGGNNFSITNTGTLGSIHNSNPGELIKISATITGGSAQTGLQVNSFNEVYVESFFNGLISTTTILDGLNIGDSLNLFTSGGGGNFSIQKDPSRVGELSFTNTGATRNIQFFCADAGGISRTVLVMGGAVPNVDLLANSVTEARTGIGQFEVLNKLVTPIINNVTGDMVLQEFVNGGNIILQSYNSVGVIKTGIRLGGTIPTVNMYADNILEAQTFVGGFNIPNKLQIAGVDQIPNDNVAVVNFVASTVDYLQTLPNVTFLAISSIIPNDIWESVGPTGSGATNIWIAMDSIPSNAKYILLKIDMGISKLTADLVELVLYGRLSGSTVSRDNKSVICKISEDFGATTAFLHILRSSVTIKIPLDANNRFDLILGSFVFTDVRSVTGYLEGFGV